ncbi:MAG TPA: TIM barrel protein [Tepidisphaeraceae bacterium]|jgi:sugar phosphate isomerase/epimerase|nr:TIM barrel protein [Tepidisphaeraceae bacterium]
MKLQFVRHLWGVNEPWETCFPKLKAAGFTAIETALPTEAERPRFKKLLNEHGFGFIAMAFSGGPDVQAHVRSFREQVEQASEFGAMKITSHAGRDAWSPAEADAFFREALAIEKSIGLPVGHETHRGRQMFNPWQARDLLERHPSLNICADFSHWVCVAERLLGDCDDIIKLTAERTIHLHARVGYEEGPQVPDPRAPEYAGALAAHERWWDMVWQSQRSRGVAVSTLTPEFGPPGYMHTLPYTGQPVANLWEICHWMADRQKTRFMDAR